MRISRILPPLSIVVLVVVLAGFFGVSSAGATSTNFTVDCLSSNRFHPNIANGDTVTWTVVGSACGHANFGLNSTPGHIFGTLTVDGTPVAPGGWLTVSPGSIVVYTAPPSGSDYDYIYFSTTGPLGEEFTVSFPLVSGSFVDNGNGTVTVTYVGTVLMAALPEGSVCPAQSVLNNFYMVLDTFRGNESPVGATSPYTQGADPNRVPAGVYQGCLYYQLVSDTAAQSGPIYIGVPAPTTTTTASADPIRPTFAG